MSDVTEISVPDPDPVDRQHRINLIVEQFFRQLQEGVAEPAQVRRQLVAEHADLAPELEDRLRFVEVVFLATRDPRGGPALGERPGIASTVEGSRRARGVPLRSVPRGIRVRCPHCGHPLELVTDDVVEVTCGGCGTSVSFDPEATRTDRAMRTPRQIGRFTIESILGQGSFGIAYSALDSQLSRRVAVKVPRGGQFTSEFEKQRFVREARSAATLRHPNIVQVHEISIDGDHPYIVSDFVDGITLSDLISTQRLSFRESVELMIQIAEAVEHAHQHGIIHRDIKPSNILLDQARRPFVTDFGLARQLGGEITMTIDGEVIGTPAYMAPEQARGELAQITPRSDLYSLGVMLYRLLTGELPYRGSQRMMIYQLLHDDPRPPRRLNEHIPRDLETITLKAMAKDPVKRYGSAQELADELRRWLRSEPIHARPVPMWMHVARWVTRNPLLATLELVLAALALAVTALGTSWAIRENRLRIESDHHAAQARASEQTSIRQLAASHRRNGLQALDENHLAAAQLWFAESLRLDPQGESLQRMRIGMIWDRLASLDDAWAVDGEVTALAFDPAGLRAAAVTGRGKIEIRDLETRRPIAGEMLHDGVVWKVRYSGDGSRLATVALDTQAALWDAASGRFIASLKHDGQVRCAAFSPDSQRIATGGVDGKVRIWNAGDGSLVETLDHGTRRVSEVVFSPDGGWLWTAARASIDEPCEMRFWKTDAWQPSEPAMTHPSAFMAAAASPDSRRIAVGFEDGALRIWEAESGGEVGPTRRHGSSIMNVLYLASGGLISQSIGGEIALWDSETAHATVKRLPAAVYALSAEPTQKLLAVGGDDGSVQLLRTPSLERSSEPLAHPRGIRSLAFHPDGQRLVVGDSGGAVWLWDLAGCAPPRPLMRHEGPLTAGCFDRSGTRILTTSRDGSGQLWSAERGTRIGPPLRHDGEVLAGVFQPEGSLVATIGGDRMLRLWNAQSGEAVGPARPHTDEPIQMAFSPGGETLITGTLAGSVYVWRPDRPEPLHTLQHSQESAVAAIAFSRDGARFATGWFDGTVRVWETLSGRPVGEPLTDLGANVKLAFGPTFDQLVTVSRSGLLRLWTLDPTPQVVQSVNLENSLTGVAWSDASHWIIVTDNTGGLSVWSEKDGQLEAAGRFREASYDASHPAFHPQLEGLAWAIYKEIGLASRGQWGAGSVRLYDVALGDRLVPPLPACGALVEAAVSPDGRLLVTAAGDFTARVWPLSVDLRPVAEIRQQAEIWSGQQLDARMRLQAIDPADWSRAYEDWRVGHAPTEEARIERRARWHEHLAWLKECETRAAAGGGD